MCGCTGQITATTLDYSESFNWRWAKTGWGMPHQEGFKVYANASQSTNHLTPKGSVVAQCGCTFYALNETGRYLMNWIQAVSFKLKEIWLLFSIAKTKKPGSFSTSLPPKHESMKANLSQKALKLCPDDNCFTEELVGILLTEFKLFISNWSRFDLYLPLLKPKTRFVFFFEWKQFPFQIWPWS